MTLDDLIARATRAPNGWREAQISYEEALSLARDSTFQRLVSHNVPADAFTNMSAPKYLVLDILVYVP